MLASRVGEIQTEHRVQSSLVARMVDRCRVLRLCRKTRRHCSSRQVCEGGKEVQPISPSIKKAADREVGE